MEVAGQLQKVVILIVNECFISPLKQVTRPTSFYIEISRIGTIEGVHKTTEIRFRRFHDKMVVVSHQDEGVKNHTKLMERIGEIGKELLIIFMGLEDFFLLVSSCSNVIESSFIKDTKWSCYR